MKQGLLLAAIALLMIYGFMAMPDRSIALANRLVKGSQLYALDDEERTNLTKFLSAVATDNHIETPLSVNAPYKRGHLNIYVVNSDVTAASQLSHGNAAYVGRSDILFIDGSYFRLGDTKVFTQSEDPLMNSVTAPVRILAFFVLAHEIGHRQLHRERTFFSFAGDNYSQQRELEADHFSIETIERLYRDEATRTAAAIPAPVSELLDFEGEPTALSRLSEHLGYAVSFASNAVFDAPFPILSHTRSHPPFFSRLRSLLEELQRQAETTKDEAALRQLDMALTIVKASSYLLAQRPVELEFSNPFQYAFIDDDTLYVVSNDGVPVFTHKLSNFEAGEQIQFSAPKPQTNATVRYAWLAGPGIVFELRRDATLQTVDVKSGKTLKTWPLKDQFGDASCAKEFVLPPQPANYVYVTYCISGAPHVALIDREGNRHGTALQDVATKALDKTYGAQHGNLDVSIVQFDLNASGMPFMVFRTLDALYAATLDTGLLTAQIISLPVSANPIPNFVENGPIRYQPKPFLMNQQGHVFRIEGTYLSRRIALVDAQSETASKIMEIDTSSDDVVNGLDGGMPFAIRQSFRLNGNRIVANLEEGGAYLIDFNANTVAPISRDSWGTVEQITSNKHGDWLYYRKYHNRVLIFKREVK